MYLRNVKQVLRAAAFDERRYGFAGLMDLLRACQREGTIRMERDRRGGLRVFQGPNLARTAATPRTESIPEPIDVTPGAVADVEEAVEIDAPDAPPVTVVDTTAELLGRAKARKPRSRATASSGDQGTSAPRAGRRTAARNASGEHQTKKAAGTRRRRSKKAQVNDADAGEG
jgi:hypothetical protein